MSDMLQTIGQITIIVCIASGLLAVVRYVTNKNPERFLKVSVVSFILLLVLVFINGFIPL